MNRRKVCAMRAQYASSPTQATGARDVAAGKAKAASRVASHGVRGIGTEPIHPNLAGERPEQLAKARRGCRAGERADPSRRAMAAPLRDTDIDDLAAYFGVDMPMSSPATGVSVSSQRAHRYRAGGFR